MKGLFLAFGLIAALFISNNVHSNIYDISTFQPPNTDVQKLFKCTTSTSTTVTATSKTYDFCYSLVSSYTSQITMTGSDWYISGVSVSVVVINESAPNYRVDWTGTKTWTKPAYNPPPAQTGGILGYILFERDSNSTSCPPSQFPSYIFPLDTNNDGVPEKCYDPNELDNNSKCSDLFNSGSILTAGSNTAPLVCKTFEDGSRCAFSRVNQGATPYYQPNLEKGCFGDAEQIPDYDKNTNEPQPQPEQCVPYAGGYACAADPKNYCSSEFECVDGCGYVNGQFICFRDEQCTGASCEPAPVDCTTVPDAPVCKEQQTTPEPSFCEKNPTVESCQSGSNFCKKNPLAPSCQLGGDNGGGGGGGFDFTLDYDRLINGMKDAAKTLIDESPIPDNTEMDKSLDDENKAIKSDYDTFLEDGVFNEIKATSQRTVFASLENIFPAGSSNCSFTMGEFTIEVCSSAEKIRGLLYWVFAILTLIYLRHLFYSTISINAGK